MANVPTQAFIDILRRAGSSQASSTLFHAARRYSGGWWALAFSTWVQCCHVQTPAWSIHSAAHREYQPAPTYGRLERRLPPACQRTGLAMNARSPRNPLHSSMASMGLEHFADSGHNLTLVVPSHRVWRALGRRWGASGDFQRMLCVPLGEAGLQGM